MPRVRRCLLAAVVLAAALAPAARAALPSDPQVPAQEPLRILRVGEALDAAARPLADVRVLVADTGLDLSHPDLASRLFALPAAVPAPNPDGLATPGTVAAGSAGWDLLGAALPGEPLQPDGDPSDPLDGSGHGTAVAGVLGAAHNNGVGGAGIAPNARFVVLRTCWDDDNCYQYLQDDAFRWAADRGVRVISLSWLTGSLEPDLRDAIADLSGVLFVTIPSGNGGAADVEGEDPQPCALDLPNVLCVSTSAPNDDLDCGGYGAASVDVAVPTANNMTTINGGIYGQTSCATSYAAPAAAGVATILLGIDPAATAAEVRSAIVDSARKVPAWAGKSVSGGIVDAAAAVKLFQQRRGLVKVTPPPSPPPPPPPPGGKDVKAPALSKLGVTRPKGGVRLTLTLDEPATLRLSLRRRSGKAYRTVRTSRRTLKSGRTTLTVVSKRPRAGRYRLVVTAVDASGNRAAAQTLAFKVG
jgi:subtilisin family serine protease